ncbi:hypothetical protein ABEB36_008173 [Hypothenemus hampei]|uniref:Uncharacterized protein n=1 Tax=Hypothenemus hampei TaxID=57062 RepID=A0ABD1EN67_HYPHA
MDSFTAMVTSNATWFFLSIQCGTAKWNKCIILFTYRRKKKSDSIRSGVAHSSDPCLPIHLFGNTDLLPDIDSAM